MNKQQEQVLVATLAGLIMVIAAAFAITPANAAGYDVDAKARVSNVQWWDVLNVRKWPAHYSVKIGELKPGNWVWVERCIEVEDSSDWCKVENGYAAGWVNSRFLTLHPEPQPYWHPAQY